MAALAVVIVLELLLIQLLLPVVDTGKLEITLQWSRLHEQRLASSTTP
jgi:hypothetical protein